MLIGVMATRNRVVSTRMPRVAAQNSATAHDTTFKHTVGDNSVLGVVGARRVETALIADQQAQGALIN